MTLGTHGADFMSQAVDLLTLRRLIQLCGWPMSTSPTRGVMID